VQNRVADTDFVLHIGCETRRCWNVALKCYAALCSDIAYSMSASYIWEVFGRLVEPGARCSRGERNC
jgi:hypothetical protein